MADYITTLSSKVDIDLASGILDIPVVQPAASGDWILQAQHYIDDSSQFSWSWKKAESAIPVQINNINPVTVVENNVSSAYTTLSIDLNGVKEVRGDDDDDDNNEESNTADDEEPIIAIRPRAGGAIVPVSFGLMAVGNEYVCARLYYGDSPGGAWFDYGNHSEANRNTSEAVPTNKTQIGTLYVDQQKRSDKCEIDTTLELTGNSQSIFVTAKSFSGKAKVVAFITWRERSV